MCKPLEFGGGGGGGGGNQFEKDGERRRREKENSKNWDIQSVRKGASWQQSLEEENWKPLMS